MSEGLEMNSAVRKGLSLAAAAGILVATMTGCAIRGEAGPTAEPTGPNPGSAVPTTNPSIEPTVPSGGTPYSIDCDRLITRQQIYDFNPNFGLIDGASPAAGTAAAEAVRAGGTACEWMNQTSGELIEVAVADPGPSSLAKLRTEAAAGTPVAGYGDAAYFSSSGRIGRVDVFQGEHWLVATSTYFGSADDAAPLLSAATAAIG